MENTNNILSNAMVRSKIVDILRSGIRYNYKAINMAEEIVTYSTKIGKVLNISGFTMRSKDTYSDKVTYIGIDIGDEILLFKIVTSRGSVYLYQRLDIITLETITIGNKLIKLMNMKEK